MDAHATLLVVLLLVAAAQVDFTNAGGKYNVTFADLDTCMEYVANQGNVYKNYYQIEALKQRPSEDDLIHIRLYVLGARDAHILLTPQMDPKSDAPVYEIVLGAGGNSFSEIRRRRKNTPMITIKRSNLLSVVEILPVEIRITKSKFIEVTVGVDNEPFMKVYVQDMVAVNYLGFASWGSVEIKFFYDCHFDSRPNDNLKKIERPMSITDRIKSVLLPMYDVEMVPSDLQFVDVKFNILRYVFATSESALKVRGQFQLSWTDRKLIWTPEEFEDERGIRLPYSETPVIWTPDLFLLNGKGDHYAALHLMLDINVQSNGRVQATSKYIDFETWCTDIGQNQIRQWPFDVVSCDIELSMLEPYVNLRKTSHEFVNVVNPNTDQGPWHLQKVRMLSDNTTNDYEQLEYEEYGEQYLAPDLAYQLVLQRNSVFLVRLFSTPLMVINVMLLASFWCTGYNRAGLTMLSQMVASIMLIVTLDYTPNSYVPRLVVYYQLSLVMSWLAFVLFVLDRCLEAYEPQELPWSWLTRCLTSGHFRMVCGLDPSNIFNNDEKKLESTWADLRTVINRFACVLFAIVFLALWSVGV